MTSDVVPPVIPVLEAEARLREGSVHLKERKLSLDEVNVESIMELLAACACKMIAKETECKEASVRVKVYSDLDKLVMGKEEIEYLEIEVRVPYGCMDREEARRVVEKCPIIPLLREKIKDIKIIH